MTADLVEFLRARLDEDELTLREANTSPEMVTGIPSSYAQAPVALHIARFADPARVLADIAAKRAIVDHVAYELADHGAGNPWWYSDKLEPILRLLVRPYADHPDYQPEWAPEEQP